MGGTSSTMQSGTATVPSPGSRYWGCEHSSGLLGHRRRRPDVGHRLWQQQWPCRIEASDHVEQAATGAATSQRHDQQRPGCALPGESLRSSTESGRASHAVGEDGRPIAGLPSRVPAHPNPQRGSLCSRAARDRSHRRQDLLRQCLRRGPVQLSSSGRRSLPVNGDHAPQPARLKCRSCR
jgi:hypothetical protein